MCINVPLNEEKLFSVKRNLVIQGNICESKKRNKILYKTFHESKSCRI